jgi:hypothetical protein
MNQSPYPSDERAERQKTRSETTMETSQMLKDSDIKVGLDKPGNTLIYGASIASVLLSLFLAPRSRGWATFTGLWAPTIIGLGIFMKENQILEEHKSMHQQQQQQYKTSAI